VGQAAKAWEDAGRPLIGVGSAGQEVEHVLLRILRDSEAHAARMAQPLRTVRMGQPPGPHLGLSGITRAKSTKMRAIRPTSAWNDHLREPSRRIELVDQLELDARDVVDVTDTAWLGAHFPKPTSGPLGEATDVSVAEDITLDE
jgi:hypothetical protein